jgi:hypothetical protein
MDILLGILRAVLFVVIAYAVVFVAALVNILYERRFMAFIGDRLGPNRTGPQGALQSIADAFKMMGKEDFRPLLADPVLFTLAPVMVMIGAVSVQLVLPYTQGVLAIDLNIGVIFLVAITSFTTLSRATAATMPSWRSEGSSVRAPYMLPKTPRIRATSRAVSSNTDSGPANRGRNFPGEYWVRSSKVPDTAFSWRPT